VPSQYVRTSGALEFFCRHLHMLHFAAFWCRFLWGEGEKTLLPIYFNDFIEGCGGDPPHPWNRHLCSAVYSITIECYSIL